MMDNALPALRMAAENGFETVLAACGICEPVASTRIIRHHPGKRCTLEIRLTTRRIVLKAFRRDPAVLAHTLRQLCAAGLDQEFGPSVTVLLGYDKALRCLVLGWLEGLTGEDLIARGDAARLAKLVKIWSRAAMAIKTGDLPRYDAKAMLADLHRWQVVIQSADSQLGNQAAMCIDRLAASPRSDGSPGLLHGSFAHLHLIDLGDGPGVLDWDEPRYGPIELDIGGMLASLARHELLFPKDASSVQLAANMIAGGQANANAVDWFRRAALVKQAKHMCKLRQPGWRKRAGGLLAVAAE